MTPNKLPPLPDPAASLYVEHFRDNPSMRNLDFVEANDFAHGTHRLYSADQMHAYGKLCSAEAFQLYVDANEARIDAEQALRQSQSLPAGAVANFRDWFAIAFPVTDLEANDGDVAASSARHVARTAWCAALQADAREKGEADWLPIESAPNDCGPVLVLYGDWIGIEHREDGCWLSHADEYEHFLSVGGAGAAGDDIVCTGPSETAPYTHWSPIPATQPAQASEKDNG